MKLFTPGPVEIPERIIKAMAQPIIHHRSREFRALLTEVRGGLKELLGGVMEGDVVLLSSSGTGAMEAVVVNAMQKGDDVLVVNSGKFGERWGEISRRYGINVHELHVEPGRPVSPVDVEHYLKESPGIRGVFLQFCETSTGVRHPVERVAEVVRGVSDALIVVDAISSFGCMGLSIEKEGIDIMVGGSQKGLMLPPGLSFVYMGERGWRRAEETHMPRYYFDLLREREAQAKGQTAYTPAISLVMGLRESIRMLKEEGIERVYRRHRVIGRMIREAVLGIGFSLFAPESPSDSITSVTGGVMEPETLRKEMKERKGILVAGGQGGLKGKIWRVAHMGQVTPDDSLEFIASLEEVIFLAGGGDFRGEGLERARRMLREEVF